MEDEIIKPIVILDNIFKLQHDTKKFKKYKENAFCDAFLEKQVFADNLFQKIESIQENKTIMVESSFGTGKTFFATRFTQYLINKKYNAIYFSIWENDYKPEPFEVISKYILKEFLENLDLIEKTEKFIKGGFSKMFNYIINKDYNIEINTGIFKINTNFKPEEFINALKEEKDPIQEFKKELAGLIKELKGGKLILIIDEIDRCRPDYAMKMLEIIKHFFDIKGLIIIIMGNEEALNQGIKSLYGFENSKEKENYLTKFYDIKEELCKVNHLEYLNLIIVNYISKFNVLEVKTREYQDLTRKFEFIDNLINKEIIKGREISYKHFELLSYREVDKFFMHIDNKLLNLDHSIYCVGDRFSMSKFLKIEFANFNKSYRNNGEDSL